MFFSFTVGIHPTIQMRREDEVSEKFYKHLHLTQVPKAILQSGGTLVMLDLAHNDLVELPKSFARSMVSLADLNLSHNQIEALPPNFGRLRTLVTLDLSSNLLFDLPSSFKKLSSLEKLNLGFNQLEKLSRNLDQLKSLQEIILSHNYLYSLPSSFCNLLKLKCLNLSHNHLESLPDNFGGLCSLRQLDLSFNDLIELPTSFKILYNLEILEVSHNRLEELPVTFSSAPILRMLCVDYNLLSEAPPWINESSSLEYLSLSNNRLSHFLVEPSFPFPSLSFLDLSSNFIQHLTDYLLAFEHVEILRLGSCFYEDDSPHPSSGNQLEYLPLSFTWLANLRTLTLDNNQLEELPDSWGDLKSLDSLNLCHNLLTTLPASLYQLASLRIFLASHNKLTSLPPGIENLLSLKELNLMANKETAAKKKKMENNLESLSSNSEGRCFQMQRAAYMVADLAGSVFNTSWVMVLDYSRDGETIRLEIMGEELKEIKEKIETLYDELFSLDEVDIDKESEAYDGSMNKIGSLRVKIENERKLKEKLADIKPNGSQANIKLPQFDLPIYDGDMGKWINFKELFLTTIDAHPGLTNIQKLQYLNSAVKGEAARLIRGFPLLSENYGQAWSTLLSRYDNPRELAYAQVSKIFSLRAIKNPSAKCLHEFMDVCNEAIRNLETLELKRNQLVDVILVHFLQQKLSENLRLDWELSMDNTLPSYDKFIAFISRHARSMSCAVKECSKREETTGSRFPKCQSYGMLIEKSDTCILCKSGHHPLYMCNLFCKMPLKEKLNVVKGHKLCFNCLGKGHFSWNCRLNQRCKVCKGKHHTMIHYDKPSTEGASAQVENTTPKEHESAINLTNTQQANCNDSHVLLATARIKIKNGLGKLCTCRALLDSGSQVTMITKGCCERLGLVQRKSDRMIIGVGNTPVQHSSSTVSVTFCPLNNSEEFSVEAVVTGVLTSEIPNFRLKDPNWPTLKSLKLADPEFYIQAPIDMILGADIYTELMLNGSISLGEGLPMAINTRLGWVLIGKLMGTSESNTEVCNLSLQSEPELEFVMKRFWEIESVPSPDLCTQDEDCERLFSNNHGRDSHGRYWVKLPFRQHRPLLGESREKALRRFLSLEGKLCKNVKLYDQYRGFMKEYEHLNHMERVPIAEVKRELCRCYYMPHHPVIREQSTTTKMRVVFDASAKSENNVSLNQVLHKGPKIQQDVFFILLRFRTYPVAITADIEKMYRQIRIHPEDADYQRILWRPSPEEPVVDYRLLTVTYGTTSAPFLAMRTLQQLAEDEGQNYPEASRVTLNDFYVDDLLTGAQTIAETKELIDQLKDLMKKGGFHLRKWNSNCHEIVSHVEEMNEEKKINLEKGAISKILGIVWDHVQDTFRVNITLPEEVVTKRDLLSNIARIFDPIGFLSPTTVAMANLQRQTAVKEVEDLEGLPVYHRAILKENGEWPEVTKAIQCSYPKVFVGDGTHLYLLIEDVESLDGPNVRSVLYQYHIPHKKWIWRKVNGFAPIVISRSIVYASHDKRVYFVGGRIHSRGNKVTCTDNIVRVKLKEGRASVLVKSRKSPLTDLLVLAMTFAPSAFLFMLAETRDHSTYKVFSYHLLNKKLLLFPRMQWEQHFCNLYNYRLQTDSWGCYTTIPILGEKEGYPKNINHFTIVQDWRGVGSMLLKPSPAPVDILLRLKPPVVFLMMAPDWDSLDDLLNSVCLFSPYGKPPFDQDCAINHQSKQIHQPHNSPGFNAIRHNSTESRQDSTTDIPALLDITYVSVSSRPVSLQELRAALDSRSYTEGLVAAWPDGDDFLLRSVTRHHVPRPAAEVTWSSDNGFSGPLFPRYGRGADLGGFPITAAVFNLPPSLMVGWDETTDSLRFIGKGGFNTEELEIMSRMFNFTGDSDSVQRCDVVPSIGTNYPRTEVMDYTLPFTINPVRFVVRAPAEVPKYMALILPFTTFVWVALTLCVPICAAMFYGVFEAARRVEGPWGRKIVAWSSLLWGLFSELVRQGLPVPLEGVGPRLVAMTWMLSSLVLCSSYSGVLTSFLTIPMVEPALDSVDQLNAEVDRRAYNVGTVLGTYFVDMFLKEYSTSDVWQSSTNPRLKKLGHHMDFAPDNYVTTPELGLQRVLGSRYAFIGVTMNVNFLVARMGRHRFHQSRETFSTDMSAFSVSKGSPYRDMFDYGWVTTAVL
ncbi:hypothetical protein LAZ67_19000902 [Cordylochernes scorpioides]|uniref:Uncharacterized protein n=1 Tax=Cordylochernes scorpioides TaxID=51811 RepID=A0ABY6LK76_9ARAC|nr:hypothetical protein LAZ67_19000902 [Cordylochernes scorpioides]